MSSNSKFFKIIRGYGPEDYIEIDETELDKAHYAFLEKKDAIYSGGAVRGSEILAIQPDYHRIMGWNRGYKLSANDFSELKERSIDRECNLAISSSKDKVQYLIKTNQINLLGKPVDGFLVPKVEKRGVGFKSIDELLR